MKLTEKTRYLMLKVVNDTPSVTPVMHQLSSYTSRDGILQWLIANRIIGPTLLDWLKVEHSNSVLGMVKFVIQHHNKEKEERAIIFNKDYIK